MNLSLDIFRKKGSLVVLLAGLAVVVAAGTLLGRFVFRPRPPDVAKAELSEIARFTESEDFLKMNSKDRGDFADSLLTRYAQMTPEEQAQAREMFSWLRRTKAAREAFWLDWTIKRAREFEQLSPDEQEAYIDRWLDTMELVMGNREIRRMPGKSPSRKNMPSRSKVKIGQNIRRVLTKTSAEDRPRIAKLTGAVMRRIRQRQGR
ncbi:MAG: hypothetical protein GWP14_01590 [Actinobacteria bacterium]|nr:hypothetical protein [Actinomycetota bacterium]